MPSVSTYRTVVSIQQTRELFWLTTGLVVYKTWFFLLTFHFKDKETCSLIHCNGVCKRIQLPKKLTTGKEPLSRLAEENEVIVAIMGLGWPFLAASRLS